jgi:hypothetical protein
MGPAPVVAPTHFGWVVLIDGDQRIQELKDEASPAPKQDDARNAPRLLKDPTAKPDRKEEQRVQSELDEALNSARGLEGAITKGLEGFPVALSDARGRFRADMDRNMASLRNVRRRRANPRVMPILRRGRGPRRGLIRK